jgi:catechol 2,3-dioxygenase-like lactoylglutathione lyase family enzyme
MSVEIDGVLETCLYCEDVAEAERFYRDVLGLQFYSRQEDRHVFFRCGRGMLLIFNPAATSGEPPTVGGAIVPPHGATGPGHVAFRVDEAAIDAWRQRLAAADVAIESEVTWPGGGRSLYFRDPAGNSLELAVPDLWGS